jgi:hypothetical protein
VDLQSNPANCGACGNVCAFGDTCSAGVCVLPANGTGGDGALTASGTTTINQTLSRVSGTAGGTALTLSSPAGFAANKVILLHQSQGSAAGSWEINQIASISGGSVVTVFPLAHTYTSDSVSGAQAVVVPQYTTVTVPAGSTLRAPAWNGTVGGILAFLAQTGVTVAGSISMDANGFRGGTSYPSGNRGNTGESELGTSVPTTKANNGSGGGGGGTCVDTVAGSGGHATAAGNSNDGWNCIGVAGTASVDTAGLSLMVFGGGGGGAGNDTSSTLLPGGAGGGIIYVSTPALNVTGGITAQGAAGKSVVTPTSTNCTYNGLSGNGAGGAIYLQAASGSLGGGVQATGPAGVHHQCGPGTTDWVQSGAGAPGRIHLTGGITGTTNPAAQ